MNNALDFRNTDRSDLKQQVTITFKRCQKPDENPDLSHLMQSYESEDISPEEAKKYRTADKRRLGAYSRGDWNMRGLYVEAEILVPIGGNSFTHFTLQSAGLWNVESDCGTEYESEIWAEEEQELRNAMLKMGAAFAMLNSGKKES